MGGSVSRYDPDVGRGSLLKMWLLRYSVYRECTATLHSSPGSSTLLGALFTLFFVLRTQDEVDCVWFRHCNGPIGPCVPDVRRGDVYSGIVSVTC